MASMPGLELGHGVGEVVFVEAHASTTESVVIQGQHLESDGAGGHVAVRVGNAWPVLAQGRLQSGRW